MDVNLRSAASRRLVIAGTGSGVGKTTLTIGLMAALQRLGHVVQGFKCGPDYIDPTYHTAVTGRVSRNLDSYMLSHATVRDIYARASLGADISVIEGVMGFYDGKNPLTNEGSTAEISLLLAAPVLLVVNCQSMARSAAAIVKGFQCLEPRVNIVGVIANKVGSDGHYKLVRQAIEQECGIPVVGYLKREDTLTMPERHLGLVPSVERGELQPFFDRLAELIAATVDVERIWELAAAPPMPSLTASVAPAAGMTDASTEEGESRLADSIATAMVASDTTAAPIGASDKTATAKRASAGEAGVHSLSVNAAPSVSSASDTPNAALHEQSSTPASIFDPRPVPPEERVKIAVAKDAAFNFYYQENFELLEAYGADCMFFSPLAGETLPDGVHGLYIGGGFPEEFAESLAADSAVKQSIREAIERGMPTLAECGGFMYLTEAIENTEGQSFPMLGLIPGVVRMQKKLAALGYRDITGTEGNFLLGPANKAKGHEFHYSTFHPHEGAAITPAYETKGMRGTKPEGFLSPGGSLVAGYTHLHFASEPAIAERWIRLCSERRQHAAPISTKGV